MTQFSIFLLSFTFSWSQIIGYENVWSGKKKLFTISSPCASNNEWIASAKTKTRAETMRRAALGWNE